MHNTGYNLIKPGRFIPGLHPLIEVYQTIQGVRAKNM